MRSRGPILLTAAVSALGLFAWPVENGSAAPPTAAHGSAELIECTRGKQAVDRRAVFRGEMTQIGSGLRMQMRFHLDEKVGSSAWKTAHAHGINLPREARPGIERFAYRQRVLALRKGVSYRVQIVFRWYAPDGREVKRETERSPVCRQPGKLANLEIRDSVHVSAGPTPGTRRYRVTVGNTGNARAPKVALSLLVDGAEVDTKPIGSLGVGDRRSFSFIGPECSESVTVRIDPDDVVPEVTERDNVTTAPCTQPEPG